MSSTVWTPETTRLHCDRHLRPLSQTFTAFWRPRALGYSLMTSCEPCSASPDTKTSSRLVPSWRTLVFIGISADDLAAGGHLAKLRDLGTRIGPHFWITDRRDKSTDDWAEAAGIQVIRYPNDDGLHAELSTILTDLLTHVPIDQEELQPVVSAHVTADTDSAVLPLPSELVRETPQTIRRLLSKHVKQILESHENDAEKYRDYATFCKAYDRAIHTAWYVSSQPPDNRLFDYSIIEETGKGAFGTVYRADKGDQQVAIKVLHESVRSNTEMLQSFRRGIRSMNILSKHRINGVVPYLDASEIPAFVVMEFVEGASLKELVERTALITGVRSYELRRSL